MRNVILASSLLLAAASLSSVPCLAQSESSAVAIPDAAIPAATFSQPSAPAPAALPAPALDPGTPLSRIGVGVHVSSLGPGAEVAFRFAKNMDIRGGFNYFNYSDSFNSKGVTYSGSIKFESGEAHFDYFLWRSLHVSPGVLFSNGTLFGGSVGVPGGQSFTINGDSYTSDSSNPLTGTGALKFNKVAPSVLVGIGSLVPTGRHHFSIKFEVGGAFQGSPTVGLNFTGSVCTEGEDGPVCQSAATDTQFQADVAAQEHKYNNDISFLKFYPVISLGIGFRL